MKTFQNRSNTSPPVCSGQTPHSCFLHILQADQSNCEETNPWKIISNSFVDGSKFRENMQPKEAVLSKLFGAVFEWQGLLKTHAEVSDCRFNEDFNQVAQVLLMPFMALSAATIDVSVSSEFSWRPSLPSHCFTLDQQQSNTSIYVP